MAREAAPAKVVGALAALAVGFAYHARDLFVVVALLQIAVFLGHVAFNAPCAFLKAYITRFLRFQDIRN